MTAKKGAEAVLSLQKAVYAEHAKAPKLQRASSKEQIQQTLEKDLLRVSSSFEENVFPMPLSPTAATAAAVEAASAAGMITEEEMLMIEAVNARSEALEAVREQYASGQISKQERNMIRDVIMMSHQM